MAIDRALVDQAAREGTVVHRLYAWAADTISLGANEAARRTWDRAALERAQLPVVRRPTGGRGVWHDRTDLTYAVTGPVAVFGDLRRAYRVIHERLAAALQDIGLDTTLASPASRRATLGPGACFDRPVGGEVLVANRKMIGSAQAVFGANLLQHGAIARADRRHSLARFRLVAAEDSPRPDGIEFPLADELAEAILGAWEADGASPAPSWLVDWAETASRDYQARFDDPEWTWRR
ncbi:MAG: lipoate--protein ligase family protein [Gemmatimonadales bacterium]